MNAAYPASSGWRVLVSSGRCAKVLEFVYADRAGRFEVAIEEQPLRKALELCAVARSVETGGILIGRYAHDGQRALIVEATGPPPGSSSGRDWFKRGRRGLKRLLARRWRATPRTYYLGEWHYHTEHVPWPSQQDLHQMRTNARDPSYRCPNPMLLIVYPVADGQWSLQWFVFGPDELPVSLFSLDGECEGNVDGTEDDIEE